MARTIEFDGRTIEVPDDATDKEVAGIISAASPAQQSGVFDFLNQNVKPTLSEAGRQVGLTGRYALEGLGAGGLANIVGLPQPQGALERVVGDASRTMAGSAGIAQGARMLSSASPVVNGVLQQLQSPGMLSSAGAGLGSGIARESGADTTGQALGGIAGSIALPTAVGAARYVGGKLGNVANVIGASMGNQNSINKITSDAADKMVGDNRQSILDAMKSPTEFVPRVKPTVGEALAEANAANPNQVGGSVIKMQQTLSGAKGLEDVLPSLAKQQNASIENYSKTVDAVTKPMREIALAGANVGGVRPTIIQQEIDSVLSTPGRRASEVVNKALTGIKEKIASLPVNSNGKLNAEDLYTIRKEAGNTIAQYAKETANWDKKLTAGIEKSVQNSIDDAIERSGGAGWKNYLSTYSEGMKRIDSHLSRAENMNNIAKMVQASPMSGLGAGEIPKIPTLLSRPLMAINFVLKHTFGDVNTPVAKEMARRLSDPAEFSQLLSRPPSDPMRQVAEKVLKQSLVSNIADQVGTLTTP